MIFFISHIEISPLTVYAANPLSTRDAADQRRSYVKGGEYYIREVVSLSGDYGKVGLKQPLTSDWETQTVAPTRKSQQKQSWLGWKNKRSTSMVSIATNKGNIFLLLFSILMVCLERMPWQYL